MESYMQGVLIPWNRLPTRRCAMLALLLAALSVRPLLADPPAPTSPTPTPEPKLFKTSGLFLIPVPSNAQPAPVGGSSLVFHLRPLAPAPAPAPAPAEAEPKPLPLQYVETGPLPEISPEAQALIQAGCASCGGGGGNGLVGPPDPSGGLLGGCSSCGSNGCVPGRTPCDYCDHHTVLGRFFCGLYECVCCPDPCYEPRWQPIADSAFFTDAPRPITQQRIRWDSAWNLILPDRAEYFWSAPPLGPAITGAFHAEKRLNYDQLSLYTEVATGKISFFVDMPYRSQEGEETGNAAGFGDINLGTKTLLFDCELIQASLQFKTYLPSGNFGKGLGAGHVSLEPTMLVGIRLAADTYLQTQIGEWIPFGSPSYSGSILLANASLNQVLWRPLRNVPLIGTFEAQSWSFQHGNYTDPVLGAWQKASGYTYLNVGPGLRLFICDRADVGLGSSFAVTQFHWAEYMFRTEFRFRY
jgi:hypothetical protein